MAYWRGMLIAVGVTVAVGLTIVDVVYTFYSFEKIENLIVNIFSNIIGGLCVSVVFFLVLWSSLLIGKATGSTKRIQNILTATTATIFGVSISLVLYLVIGILLQPVNVEARILAQLPVKGVIGKRYGKEEDNQDRNTFRFIGERTQIEHVALNSAKGLSWEWTRVEEETRFSATVYVVDGCSVLDQVKELTKGRPIAEIEDAQRLRIDIDGSTQIALQGRQTGISIERGTVSQFWIDRSDTDNGVVLTEFLSDGLAIHGNTDGDLSILIASTMTQQMGNGDAIHLVPRTFDFQINDQALQIVFSPKSPMVNDVRIICRSLKERSDLAMVNTYDDVVLAGLYVEINRIQLPRNYLASFDGEYRFKDATGWFRRRDVDHDDLRTAASEELGMIVIETPVHELFVNGRRYEVPTNAGFRGHGKIRAAYRETSGLTFSGTFHAAWLGELRLNFTRWERWTVEVKLGVLTAILSIAVAITTLVIRTRNKWIKYWT